MTMRLVLVLFLAAAVATPTRAVEWPQQPVKVVVPYGAGGGVDTFTRTLATQLGEQLKQPFVIDNRPGAGGTIGVLHVAKAPADGYTLLSGGVHQPMAEALYARRGYDMEKDFIPIALTAVVPNVLVVGPRTPFKSVAQLLAFARANPGRLTYCSSGNGTSQHVIAEMFKMATRVDMLHVPHRGTAAAMTTLLSGDCDMMFDGLGTSAQHLNSGRLRALALTVDHRSPEFPDIPTMKETGGPDMRAGTWYGWWAPAKTPTAVVEALRRQLTEALGHPRITAFWKAQGAQVPAVGADRIDAYVREEIQRWTRINRDAGIRID